MFADVLRRMIVGDSDFWISKIKKEFWAKILGAIPCVSGGLTSSVMQPNSSVVFNRVFQFSTLVLYTFIVEFIWCDTGAFGRQEKIAVAPR